MSGRMVQMAVLMILGGGVYGAVLGSWRGGGQAACAAAKLPLVLVATSALTLAFNWMAAAILGMRLTPAHAAGLTFFALATASVVLGSLAPIVTGEKRFFVEHLRESSRLVQEGPP